MNCRSVLPFAPQARLLTLLLLLGTGLLACAGEAPEPPPAERTSTGVEEDAAATVTVPEPVIHTEGPMGVVPERLVISFGEGIFSTRQFGESFDATVLTFDPPATGRLSLRDTETLIFEPAAPFRPGTEYTVRLEAVEAGELGLVRPPSEGAWTASFTTPAFELVRLALVDLEARQDRALVELVFTAAVDPAEVRRRARFEVVAESSRSSRAVQAVFETGRETHIVNAFVPNRGLSPGTRLELTLEEGARSVADRDQRAAAANASVHFGKAPGVRISDVTLAESDNGFYLQVICDDTALEDRLGFWDPVSNRWWEVSQRCLPDDDSAREAIHFEPPIPFTVGPSRGGFRVFADFGRGPHTLSLHAGLETVDGGVLPNLHQTTFQVPARRPSLAFVSQGRYLPRSAWQLLPIRHRNVDRARLEIRHVPPENLVFWMSDETSERADARDSNLIHTTQLALRGPEDAETTSYIDLSTYVSQDIRGLMELRLAGSGAGATARLLLTDLHLVAKRSQSGEVRAWALDLHDLRPVRGVDIELVRQSGYVMASCRTGGAGSCGLRPRADEVDPSPPYALLAKGGGELTYLKFADLEVEVQEERIAGEPYRGGRPYRAAVYTDRGVYRPGETAHLAAIVRDRGDGAPPAGLPVRAQLVDPRGKTIRSSIVTTNDAGWVTLDLDFPDFATTGRYAVRLEVAKAPIGEAAFQVEEFVPERMKVEATPAASHFQLGDEMAIDVTARYLFGGVPAGHRLELRCDLEPGRFQPAENGNYHYGVWTPGDGPGRGIQLGTASGALDEEGHGRLVCPGSRAGGFAGPANLVARAAVFESGSGRTTVGRVAVPVHPADIYIGLSSGAEEAKAGEDLVIDGVTVDWQGRLADGVASVELELVRLVTEYGWYFDPASGRWTNRQQDRPVTEERRTVAVAGGKFQTVFRPASDGAAFLVRARSGAARTDLELAGRGRWYWYRPEEGDRTPSPGRATWLALSTPRLGRVGEAIEATFEVPYPGRLLLTAETDEILWSEWREVEAGPARFSFEPERFVPNVYLSAFLIKDPHLESPEAYLPERAFGVTSVALEPVELTHPLALEVPAEIRSSSRLEVALDLGPVDGPTWATVAAVDQGILSLTRFPSPDPFPAIFNRRALGVDTFETVGWTLLVPPGSPTSTPAGDTAGGLGRVQPIRPVALWSGLRQVPADGKLRVELEVPSYRGALRVMAVTAGPRKMGRADAEVVVRDPLVVQSTLPRFLTRGDDVRVPVFVTNVSGVEREVKVELRASAAALPGIVELGESPPPVEILGDPDVVLPLADGESGTAVFRLQARATVGAAKLEVVVSSGDLRSREELEVPLLPAGPKTRRVERLELDTGTLDLLPHLEGWMPLSERTTFWVTNQPYGDALDHLKYLIRYPHGCLEQTSSTTRPLLFLTNLIPTLDPRLAQPGELERMAQSGVDRLLSMQTPSGGFGYWPGHTEPVYWGTAYVTHILLEARDQGFQVPQSALDDALDWMERQITQVYERGQSPNEWYSQNAEPYLHLVLSMAGRPRKARIERLLEELGPRPGGSEQKEHLYMLWAALHLAGDQRFEANLKSPDVSTVANERDNGWTFYSDRRRRGVMLSLMVDLFGRDPAAERLANLVAEMLRGHEGSWYTTQELAWAVVGLGKFSEAGAADFAPPVLTANGRRVAPQPQLGGSPSRDRTFSLARASEHDSLTLTVPEKGDGKLWLILSSEGVRAGGKYPVGGDGLVLTRRYKDASGRELELGAADAGAHRLGDLIYVELVLSNTSPERIANLALVDRIPAGWEIENPRLGRGSAPDWVKTDELWPLDHLDLRDDRIEVFGHLDRGRSGTVVYAVRAVTAGRFTIPPVEAEAMYDPRIWARKAGGEIVVDGPWRDGSGPAANRDAGSP